MVPRLPTSSRRIQLAATLLLAFAAVTLVARLPAQETTAQLDPLEHVVDFWNLGTAPPEQEYRLRAQVVVVYYDPEWRAIWVDWDDRLCYLPASGEPLPLKPGQRIELDGVVRPGRQQIVWERTRIKVLENSVAIPAYPFTADTPLDFDARFVELEAYVSQQLEPDPTHLNLELALGERSVVVLSYLGFDAALPQLQGAFVRARGLLSVKRNAGQGVRLELWVADPHRIEVLSLLRDDPRFDPPATAVEDLSSASAEALVRVEGVVHSQERGKSVTLRDATGQVKIFSPQTEPLNAGDAIEAVGYPDTRSVEPALRRSLFRLRLQPGTAPGSTRVGLSRLRLTEQVRELSPVEADRAYPVQLFGVVTWIDEAAKWFFLQDGSGGVKVLLPEDGSIPLPELEAGVNVIGVTRSGPFVPEVRASVANRRASMALPATRLITLEQARTGAEHARWVAMRGYVQSVARDGRFERLQLTTSRGEFIARLPAVNWPVDLAGAVVELRAVCDTVVNPRRQITGVQLWIPGYEFIEVVEPAPADPFATPRRTLESLLQFSSASALNQRVQVSGIVIAQRPGEYVHLQDGNDTLFVLSRETAPLEPGDRVDVVGFPGYAGWRLTMRDALYRRVGHGPEPEPHVLLNLASPDGDLDGRLVRLQATLLNILPRGRETRLQLQSGPTLFEAVWPGPATSAGVAKLQPGSELGLTGVYRVDADAYGQPRAFDLALRSSADLRIIRQPSWWTAPRVLWIAAALLAVAMLTIGWGLVLSRKNQLLAQAQRELRTANDELEARVSARTRDLRQEVAERERSEAALAEERMLLRAVIDHLPVSLYVKDVAGRFVVCNLVHTRLLGAATEADVVGKTVFDFYPPELAREKDAEERELLRAGQPLLSRETAFELEGQSRWFMVTKVPLRDGRDRIGGLICIAQDITERRQAEAEREHLNRRLLETSRRAGMAEVATSVLHNVGNVLNSVNVSATLAIDRLRGSKAAFVPKVGAMLQENADRLAVFLASDPKGRKVPSYLATLGQQLLAERDEVTAELEHLRKNIEHIKGIVAMQQSYAKVSGVAEVVSLVELFEDAVRMNSTSPGRHPVEFVRDYAARPTLAIDRHKVMQILVNLVRNATHACVAANRPDSRITLRIAETGAGVRLSVSDNGVGIAPENLTRIFAHGFTTKKEGHGFGLHSGALAAKELGGTLTVQSDGPGRGATFTLELPVPRHGSKAPFRYHRPAVTLA